MKSDSASRVFPSSPWLLLICFSLYGCMGSATGSIRDNFYHPTDQSISKFPLKVALVVNDATKSQKFEIAAKHQFTVFAHPGLTNAVKAELSTLFREVTVIDNISQVKDEDIIASSQFDVSSEQSGNELFIRSQIKASFKDARTGTSVTNYRNEDRSQIRGNFPISPIDVLLAMTLVLLPAAMQMQADSWVEPVIGDVEKRLEKLVSGMSEALQSNRQLMAYVTDRGQSVATLPRGQPLGMSDNERPTQTVRQQVASDVDQLPVGKVTPMKNAYAVVIGIEQYREKLPKADFADRDATLMGEYLTKVLGYPAENVIVRLNDRATRTDMVKYLEEWLKNNVEPGGSVFVYYSGHGTPNPKTGEAYLVPYDGDPSFVDSTAYPLKQLYAALDKLPVKDVTVVLDSCFSGAGGRSVLAEGARPMVLSVENTLLASSKTVVLAASSGNQISSTFKEQGHGLLTYYFLKGLQGEGDLNKDGKIDMAELYEYVKPNVQKVARKLYNNEQTPQLLGSPETLKRGVRLIESRTP